ncbi:PorT family protein [Labilibacter sediminis]|nr:PorT family protein [Labilibacter sediminis]
MRNYQINQHLAKGLFYQRNVFMRKEIRVLIIVMCIASYHVVLKGQEKKNIEVGVKGGMNLSKANFSSSDGDLNYRPGYYVGGYIGIPLKNDLSINGEVLFIAKGWNIPEDSGNKNVSVTFNIIELPVLLKYAVSDKIKFMLGPSIGYKISSKRRPESEWKDNFEDLTLNVIGGAEYSISENIGVEIRYSQGIKALYNGLDFDEYGGMIENLSLKDGYMHSIELGLKYSF